MKITLCFLLAAAMGLTPAWAQRSGSTPPGGTTGGTTGGTPGGTTGTTPGGTTGTTPSTTTPLPTNTTQPTQQPATLQRPIFLSGLVTTDDGSPLPGSVTIQSVCGAVQRNVAHTTSRGDFGFQWGNTGSIMADASETGRIAGGSSGSSVSTGGNSSGAGSGIGGFFHDQLTDCDLRAEYAGYSSSRISLYSHSALDNPDVGIIVLHRLSGDEGHLVSALSLKAPKDAKKNFDKGTDQVKANKLTDAAASFQKAVTTYPQYADAWVSLGRVQSKLGSKEDARAAFQKAMDLDGKLVEPWQELGYLSSDQSKWADAAKYLDTAVKLDPMSSPMAWYFDAMANYNLGKYDLAERSVRAMIKLDPERKNKHVDYLLGLVLIARQDYQGGADMLRSYIASSPNASDVETAKMQLSQLEGRLSKNK